MPNDSLKGKLSGEAGMRAHRPEALGGRIIRKLPDNNVLKSLAMYTDGSS